MNNDIAPREKLFRSSAHTYVFLALLPTLLTISAISRNENVESVMWLVVSIILCSMAINRYVKYSEGQ